jgi:hypothetical protein
VVDAHLANTTGGTGGTDGGGKGTQVRTDLTEFEHDGKKYYKVPGTLVFANPKQTGQFSRPVALTEDIWTCTAPTTDGKGKMQAFPYVASTDPDMNAPAKYGQMACHKCKLYQHTKHRCLQK